MSLIYLRHGETKLNRDSAERLRGWLPVGLDRRGKEEAEAAAKQLVGSGVKPASFSTSDLQRAVETADPVGKAIGMKAEPKFELRDWNTGDLAGQEVDKVLPQLHHLIDHPEQSAPNGEPLLQYLHRFFPYIKSLVESPDTHLVVGHARGSQIIHSAVNRRGQGFDHMPLKEKPALGPGQMLYVAQDWSTLPELK